MTITDSQPARAVIVKLDFLRPFKCTNRVEFTLEPQGPATTRVTWAMSGKNDTMSKIVQLFVSMDKMCGGDFEKGLGKLKSLVEAGAR
jgi:hypothetical protein